MCQSARSAHWAARVHAAMPAIVADHPTWRFIFLTVTLPSVPVLELRQAKQDLHDALDRMAKRKGFAPLGYIRNTETTIANGMVHVHGHLLCAVPAAYFTAPLRKERGANGRPRIVPGYMTQRQWQLLWAECRGLEVPISYLEVPDATMSQEDWRAMWPNNDAPVIDVRAIKGDLRTASARKELYEITKYGQKPADLIRMQPDEFSALHLQIKGTRTISICGALAPYLQEIEEEEDEPVFANVVIAARWNETEKRYFTDFGRPLDDGTWYDEAKEKREQLNARQKHDYRALFQRSLVKNALTAADYADAQRIRDGTATRATLRIERESAAEDERRFRMDGAEERRNDAWWRGLLDVANRTRAGELRAFDDFHTCAVPLEWAGAEPITWQLIDGTLRRAPSRVAPDGEDVHELSGGVLGAVEKRARDTLS